MYATYAVIIVSCYYRVCRCVIECVIIDCAVSHFSLLISIAMEASMQHDAVVVNTEHSGTLMEPIIVNTDDESNDEEPSIQR